MVVAHFEELRGKMDRKISDMLFAPRPVPPQAGHFPVPWQFSQSRLVVFK